MVLALLALIVATVVPAYLAVQREAKARECSLRLMAILEAKRDVMKEMNQILPRDRQLKYTDRVNPLHLDKISHLTLRSPWRFHPDDPCPLGGKVSVGETFLDPPTCSLGHPIAEREALEEKKATP